MTKIILATKSPYRQDIFRQLGIDFIADGSEIDENSESRPSTPKELVEHLARLKAEAVAKKHQEGIVIGFDSIGWLEGSVLEKPKSIEDGFKRLKSLSGKTYEFYTGIHMIDAAIKKSLTKTVKTVVYMRNLHDGEIKKYLDQDPNFNTYASGFDARKNYSATFVSRIEGSYNNFMTGLPLEVIVEMLTDMGCEI